MAGVGALVAEKIREKVYLIELWMIKDHEDHLAKCPQTIYFFILFNELVNSRDSSVAMLYFTTSQRSYLQRLNLSIFSSFKKPIIFTNTFNMSTLNKSKPYTNFCPSSFLTSMNVNYLTNFFTAFCCPAKTAVLSVYLNQTIRQQSSCEGCFMS